MTLAVLNPASPLDAKPSVQPRVPSRALNRTPKRTLDRFFFTSMILVLWATVLIGFGRTYFFAGMTHAPLSNLLIHIHGAAFTLWMFLLLVVAFDLVSLHRISRATLWASLLMIVVHVLHMPIGSTPLWIAFAGHARGL